MATSPPLPDGIVYTETVVYAGPEKFLADVPYQIAIIDLADGARCTARIVRRGAAKLGIGDPVRFSGYRDGVPYFEAAADGEEGSGL